MRSDSSPDAARRTAPFKKLAFYTVLVAPALIAGVYAAELVFRNGIAVPSVPRTEREFRRLVASQWPAPIAPEKPPGRLRILGLADSFGLAGGADNYHFQLERILRERGHDVEVVNFSVAAYSLDDELQLLRRFGARFRPDLVLHGFFVGNDFAPRGGAALRYRGIDVALREGPASWLPRNLALPRWLGRWREAVRERRLRDEEVAAGAAAGGFSESRFLAIERVRFSVCRLPRREGPAWPAIVQLLDAIGGASEKLGATRVMVVHPDQFQVEPALVDEIVRTYELDASQYDVDLPQKFLATYAASRRVTTVDLTEAFRAAGSAGGLYLPRDTHYNEAGNRLAAERIADALEPLLRAAAGEDAAQAASISSRAVPGRRPAG